MVYKPALNLLLNAIKKCDPDGKFTRLLGTVPHENIHNHYRKYDAFIFASLYETFGFPIFEAMAAGLPIASSDFELTREILGNDAMYFDPRNPESIAEAVIKLIEDKELREKIALNNFEKAKKYTWKKCADRTFKFFEKCAINR